MSLSWKALPEGKSISNYRLSRAHCIIKHIACNIGTENKVCNIGISCAVEDFRMACSWQHHQWISFSSNSPSQTYPTVTSTSAAHLQLCIQLKIFIELDTCTTNLATSHRFSWKRWHSSSMNFFLQGNIEFSTSCIILAGIALYKVDKLLVLSIEWNFVLIRFPHMWNWSMQLHLIGQLLAIHRKSWTDLKSLHCFWQFGPSGGVNGLTLHCASLALCCTCNVKWALVTGNFF